jgi:hypothetical protein
VRSRSVLLLALLLALAVSTWGQNVLPAPAITSAAGGNNDIAVSGIVSLRQGGNTGIGMDASASRFFTKHLAFTVEADDLKSDFVSFREYGFRGGATYRLFSARRVQPFVRGLAGYSRLKELPTGTNEPYVSGFSYIAGGGADVLVVGALAARVSADLENDPSFTNKLTGVHYSVHVGRIGFGLKYSFGGYR